MNSEWFPLITCSGIVSGNISAFWALCRLERSAPRRFHNLQKRIFWLMKRHNYYKADEIREERNLGLWAEAPDYFYKDKTRRSFLMKPYSAT